VTSPDLAANELFDRRYAALASRDARFDGQFIAGVHTTGIYCRPSCPAVTPKPGNVNFYRTAAAAHDAGLRACKRCQPDAVPGSPDWNLHDDLASRAMRLVSDGVVEREGVEGLARRLGYTSRHVTRVLRAELGAGPLALARAHRAQTARSLLAATELPISDIAFAAGFGSLRQFNDTIAEVYRATPTELRALARRGARASDGPRGRIDRRSDDVATPLTLHLPARTPFDGAGLMRFFADHAVPGLERGDDESFSRSLLLPHGRAEVCVRLDGERPGVIVTAHLASLADVPALSSRVRRLFDLDADSVAIDAALATDPVLRPLIAARPGIRIPGATDGTELLIRTLIGQQISVAAARTVLGRLVAELGEGGFPSAEAIAQRGAEVLRGPARRVATIVRAADALARGALRLDLETPAAELREQLLAVPGIGPWTADYLVLRGLGNPDTFLGTDLVIRQSAEALGLPGAPRALAERSAGWAPWRSYATLHLWRHRPAPRVPHRSVVKE
jgi:AraC family transcriptional regulator of adaptative response / DNA-3-methyladenine glycosylase II